MVLIIPEEEESHLESRFYDVENMFNSAWLLWECRRYVDYPQGSNFCPNFGYSESPQFI